MSLPGSGLVGISPLPVATKMSPLLSTTGGDPDCQMPAPGPVEVSATFVSLDHLVVIDAELSETPMSHPSHGPESHWDPNDA